MIRYNICENMEHLERCWQEEALTLHADHASRYKDKFLAFRTVMKVI